MTLTPDEQDRLSRMAREAVIETLKILGFNVEKPEELRADMDHLRRFRGYWEAGTRAFVMALGAGVLTVIGLGVKAWLS